MLTCPVCSCSNPNGSISCERCNSAFEGIDQTLAADFGKHDTGGRDASGSAKDSFSGLNLSGSEFDAGEVIAGRYRIVRQLGQGGMGTVYEAFDVELERTIALKSIRPDLAANPAAVRRLKQETLLTRQIAHRNVVRIFDLGVADGLRFITMEFVDGTDLKSLLGTRGRFSPKDAVAVMKQVCQGLQAAHTEDVIHRDLKPQNILVGRDNRVRIVDFGLARSFEQTGITRTGTVLGTPHYMAPEQALGGQSDARSDIFALGVVFYELLTGELPFPADNMIESFLARTRDRARPIDSIDRSIPQWLARAVMRCLDREPGRRYQNAQELLEELNAAEAPRSSSHASVSGVFAPGMILGSRYLIEAEAGEGGMGKVYRARDLDLDRTVALKIVRPELASDPNGLLRLKHEISLASQISHRNVLRIHDLGEADGLRFVSMAWADGEDLSHLLRRYGSLPEERIVQLAIEMCEGLAAAHEQGIVHRDLKPSNVLLDSAGRACIADFGLARMVETQQQFLSRAGEVHGTPRYMSPEQAEGKLVDSRSDIYSLGLILYEMSTGKIPFKDDSVFQTLALRVAEIPQSPKLVNPALSEKLVAIILRCLERDPRNRYATTRELLSALRQLEAENAVPEDRADGGRRNRFRRAWIFGAFIAAAVVIAVAAFFLYYGATTPRPYSASGKYIAVLPFRALSPDPNLRYEAEGIADSISSRLFSLNGVHPISVQALRRVDLNQPGAAIGRQVGANLIVNGTVQGQADRIQVIVSVDDLKKDARVWSQAFTGVRADLFTLEDEIAGHLVQALSITPTTEERERATIPPTQNLAAYDLYLKGRDILKNRVDAAAAGEALALFDQACGKDPDFALAWTGIADSSLLLYKTKKESFWAEKALAAAREASRRNDNLPEVYFALGSVYTATGKNAQAVEEIKKALQLQPNSDDGYIRLGKAYAATGQAEPALGAFKKAVELNPYYWYNYKQLGWAYFQFGRNQEALKEFKRQIDLNPKDWSGYNNAGAIYYTQGHWKDCIPYFQKAIKLHPTFDSYSNLGTAYYQLGRYSESIQMFETAVDLNPNSSEAMRNLAQAYNLAGRKDKAKLTYDRAISAAYNELQVNPRKADAMGTLAMCYAAKGEISRAQQFIQSARSIDGANSQLMYFEAVVLSLQGHRREALSALQRALQNGESLDEVINDPDLKPVRQLPEFSSLAKQFSQASEARRR
jgi:serine/threonine protein kinase/tetratricopeptide (TPR) repeat protein